jgi:hypothetical protein
MYTCASGRGFRIKDTTRLAQGLLADKLDDNGHPIKRLQRGQRSANSGAARSKASVTVVDSDIDDDDFRETESQSGSDSEGLDLGNHEEYVLENEEVCPNVFACIHVPNFSYCL